MRLMVDDTKIKQPADPLRINLSQFWEINYWTDKFEISVSKLKEAVDAVGVMVIDVEAWLKKN